jgi:CRP/FNR family transcriptional regulator
MAIDKIEALRRTPLFAELEPEQLRLLADRAIEHKLAKGEILFLAGDPARGLFVIAEGAVRAYRVGADGREQVIHVESAGATLAEVPLFDEGAYPSTAAGEEDSIVLLLPKQEVRRLFLEHPEIAMTALKVMARRLRNCAALVETLSLHDVDRRLARFLLHELRAHGVRSGRSLRMDFPLTHQQVASRIGTVREVASRAFSRLQQGSLIRVENKAVIIPDEPALAAYVEGV